MHDIYNNDKIITIMLVFHFQPIISTKLHNFSRRRLAHKKSMQKFGIWPILSYLPAVTPPTLVPATMSPTGKIFSNHSTWSIQVNKQVCDIFVSVDIKVNTIKRLGEREKGNEGESELERVCGGGGWMDEESQDGR
jgi:hypothetical protein